LQYFKTFNMKHASLFSGIGGFDLAAEWVGWENVFHCEWNPFGQQVLKHHFPNSISYNDITKTDFKVHANEIDILTGGFPCQPYSQAGKRLGKADERHLFPEMLRCIKEVKPRWIIGENVRGLVSWNEGLVFNEVYDDLEREGYEVQSFLIPAAGVNAPHQRYRIWFVAYSNSIGRNKVNRFTNGESNFINEIGEAGIITNSDNKERWGENNNNRKWENIKQESYNRNELWDNIGSISESTNVTNSSSEGCKWGSENRETNNKKWEDSKLWETTSKYNTGYWWETFPTQSAICGGDDGISREMDGITFPKWRNESIKAYGNAIVPQVAYQIFQAINEFEMQNI
jgi:DNA (cytosine-5)-methyltransferase 1